MSTLVDRRPDLAEKPTDAATATDDSTGAAFDVPPGRVLLDAALDAGVDLAHGCRNGVCGACAVEVVEGVENLEPRDFIEADSACRFHFDAATRLACRMRTRGSISFRPA